MTAIYAIVIFLLLIFIHEFGHFIAAKACDVKVNEFALGMGPLLWSRQGKETKYSLRAIPIGGYCAMEGEDEDSDDERALNKKNGWQKFLVFIAGAAMNFVLGLIIMILIAFSSGIATTTLGEVEQGMPAHEAGLRAGDTIVAMDGKEMGSWNDITNVISTTKKESLEVRVLRNEEELEFQVPVGYNEEEKRNVLGIITKPSRAPGKCIANGCRGTWDMTIGMYKILGQLFTGEVSTKELSGPVGIVSVVSQTSKMGFIYVVYLTALISLNLAIINLLPFPALDGGRILFLIIRKITGKAVTDEMEARFHMVGIALLLGLMVYVTFNDIGRLIG